MIKKLLLLSLLSLSILSCSNKINYFECEGRAWNVYNDYITNEEMISKKLERSTTRELRIKESIFGYEINGSSCNTYNNDVLRCGKNECFASLVEGFKDSPECKDSFWVSHFFDMLNGQYSLYIYEPRKEKNEYTYEHFEMKCKRKPAALN
jgi:hypothetical protein